MTDRATKVYTLITASSSVTGSSNTTGVNTDKYHEGTLYLKLSGVTGTIEFQLKTSPDNGDYYVHDDMTVPVQFTGAGSRAVTLTGIGKFARLDYTVSSGGSCTVDEAFLVCKN